MACVHHNNGSTNHSLDIVTRIMLIIIGLPCDFKVEHVFMFVLSSWMLRFNL